LPLIEVVTVCCSFFISDVFYSRGEKNPTLNPKTHCVMVRLDDVEWNRPHYVRAIERADNNRLSQGHFFGQKFRVHKVDKG
jgi:hypothetical protein